MDELSGTGNRQSRQVWIGRSGDTNFSFAPRYSCEVSGTLKGTNRMRTTSKVRLRRDDFFRSLCGNLVDFHSVAILQSANCISHLDLPAVDRNLAHVRTIIWDAAHLTVADHKVVIPLRTSNISFMPSRPLSLYSDAFPPSTEPVALIPGRTCCLDAAAKKRVSRC
jgi:hypothetical protein